MPDGISQRDVYLHFLWTRYQRSSRSEKAKIVEEIRESLKYMADLDTRIRMIELLLFGPRMMSPIRDSGLPLVVVDDWECYKSSV
ncbi:hypothetical protein L1987_15963 [Smallanthus sonchifolius]|uniref:Uncharacterized protein n=1 Tax=Smallanthus sonchifolius TaxID=185202 RepID=A0ACB9J7K2_9ASTR|nr:hypothetical protein L1987_15963 [Smallanthus sonchifolius]